MVRFNTSKKSTNSADLTAKISKVAYELYEKRGRTSGHEMEDWLKAERLVKSSKY